jgi:hypothetical protein
MSFHLTHVSYVYHWVRPKWFPCLWYTRRKPCNYLVLRLTLSLNQSKQASTWTTSPWSTIECVKMISKSMVRSTQTVHVSCVEINIISKWSETSFHLTHVTYEYHQLCPKPFPSSWYIRRKPYTCVVPKLKLSPNGSKWASTWSTSPRSTIWCGQNDFLSLWYVRPNRAPILRRD